MLIPSARTRCPPHLCFCPAHCVVVCCVLLCVVVHVGVVMTEVVMPLSESKTNAEEKRKEILMEERKCTGEVQHAAQRTRYKQTQTQTQTRTQTQTLTHTTQPRTELTAGMSRVRRLCGISARWFDVVHLLRMCVLYACVV